MSYCPKCKVKEFSPKGSYHSSCGTKLIDYTPKCPSCGEEVHPFDKFCAVCGKPVKSWIGRKSTELGFMAVVSVLLLWFLLLVKVLKGV